MGTHSVYVNWRHVICFRPQNIYTFDTTHFAISSCEIFQAMTQKNALKYIWKNTEKN